MTEVDTVQSTMRHNLCNQKTQTFVLKILSEVKRFAYFRVLQNKITIYMKLQKANAEQIIFCHVFFEPPNPEKPIRAAMSGSKPSSVLSASLSSSASFCQVPKAKILF